MCLLKRALPYFITIVVFLCLTVCVPNRTYATTSTVTPDSPYTKKEVVASINNIRSQRDLQTLTPKGALTRAAQKKADDMAKRDYFSHETPSGVKYWAFISHEGYLYKNAGENLAVHYNTVSALMKSWLKSPEHRANIMNTTYTDVGIGIAYGERKGQKGWYVVAMFGSKLYKPIYSYQ